MDVETSGAIDRVGNRMDALGNRVDALERSLGSRIDAVGDRLTSVEQRLRAEIAESRRHSQMLFESLRDDIRILADGFAVLSSKIDRPSA